MQRSCGRCVPGTVKEQQGGQFPVHSKIYGGGTGDLVSKELRNIMGQGQISEALKVTVRILTFS